MSTIYNSAKVGFLDGTLDFDTDTIRVALISSSIAYTPDVDNDVYVADVLNGVDADEFAGTGYTRQTLADTSVTQDNTDDEGVADASDVVFSGIDGDTVDAVLIYKQVGGDDLSPEDDPLIAHLTSVDFPLPANGGDVTISFAAEGILNLQ